jgi:hypothetical protein
MENPIEELNSESLDSIIARYKTTLEDCINSFKPMSVPGLKEDEYDLSLIDKECADYLKSHTEFALKLTLDSLIEFMEETEYADSESEIRPIFLKGEETFAYLVYRYMDHDYMIRKFILDDSYSIVKEKMKYLCLKFDENLKFFTDGRTNESEFNLSKAKQLSTDQNQEEDKDDDPYSEIDYLSAEDEEAYESMYSDPTYDMSDEEIEDYTLVQKASKLGVMPWEILPLRDEYRNTPFSQWDVKPILPVINYTPSFDIPEDEDYQFINYGLRDGDILVEDRYAYYANSESFSLNWYKENSDPYINKLLKAMIAGRKSLEDFDFQKYLKKMTEYKLEQDKLLEETKKEYLDDNDEEGFTDYVNSIRESIDNFPYEDDMYISVITDDELKDYAHRKFQQEKSVDVEHFINWNRKYVYPKILKTS